MNDFILYLMKMSTCSGIFFLFYVLALRNKNFHQWNRFYLLTAVIISILVPLFRFSIYTSTIESPGKPIQLLQVVQSANVYFDELAVASEDQAPFTGFTLWVYILISCILLLTFLHSVLKILSIIFRNRIQRVDRINVVHSNTSGTPFTFLHYVFWNDGIEFDSQSGQRIFLHEAVHVKEKHTLDRIFIQMALVVFWINPFFWIIRKELKLIHEFIADKKSVEGQGVESFAAMILQSVFPSGFNMITSHFFQSSIKRRIHMLTKINHPKINYFTRILAFGIIAFTVFAFTVISPKAPKQVITLEKEINVVIDAGHGKLPNGNFTGARQGEFYEDEIVLSIAQKIKNLNQNQHIKILLSRSSDEIVDLKERVEYAKKFNADLFISLHVAASVPNNPVQNHSNGFEIIIPNSQPFYQKTSEVLGSILQQELKNVHYTYPELINPGSGIWVLNKNVCTSVLIECGYITDKADREFITDGENQKLVAEKILTAIEKFATETDK